MYGFWGFWDQRFIGLEMNKYQSISPCSLSDLLKCSFSVQFSSMISTRS